MKHPSLSLLPLSLFVVTVRERTKKKKKNNLPSRNPFLDPPSRGACVRAGMHQNLDQGVFTGRRTARKQATAGTRRLKTSTSVLYEVQGSKGLNAFLFLCILFFSVHESRVIPFVRQTDGPWRRPARPPILSTAFNGHPGTPEWHPYDSTVFGFSLFFFFLFSPSVPLVSLVNPAARWALVLVMSRFLSRSISFFIYFLACPLCPGFLFLLLLSSHTPRVSILAKWPESLLL